MGHGNSAGGARADASLSVGNLVQKQKQLLKSGKNADIKTLQSYFDLLGFMHYAPF